MEDWINDVQTEDDIMRGCAYRLIAFGVFWLILLACMVLFGCTTTKYVPVVTTHTDTLIITKQQRDSIYLKDSTHVSEQQRGDTVYIKVTRWRTEFRDRELHDTIYQSHTDTVPIPYPVEVVEEVEKPLTWWQQLKMNCGLLFLGLVGLIIIIGIVKIKKKIMP